MNKTNQTNNPIEEFYLASREYCRFTETTQQKTKLEFLSGSQKILSLIYLKASLLERFDEMLDEEVEKFVQEDDWTYIQNAVSSKIGSSEKYIEVILPDNQEPDNIETLGLSDCFADIYQDLKDFVLNYEIDNPDSVSAGLSNCLFAFDKYWGPKLLAILVNIHTIIYSNEAVIDEKMLYIDELTKGKANTNDWLINKRFNQ